MSGGRAEKLLKPVGLDSVVTTRTYQRARDPKWLLDPRAVRSREHLQAIRNSEAGASGVIVGTGPSLLKTDLTAIGDRPSIGLNRLFQGFESLGFKPDRLVCINLMMLEQSARDIAKAGVPVYASWAARHHFESHTADAAVVFLRTMDGTDFSKDLEDRMYTGSTVTYAALQLAHWLGWQDVTLLGIDHCYRLEQHEEQLGPHATAVRQAPDANHFLPSYFPAGEPWQLPDLASSEDAYAVARRTFDIDGRKVLDGTIGGALDIFEKTEWPQRAGNSSVGNLSE
ncbi:MAG: 6-hydroxymethylpterin diphosphokinase MptE-like protein [Pseudomonadota bacterium]